MTHEVLKVLVLAGGPDRERPVSLVSGGQVTAALREAGHEVIQRDIGPDDLSALDEFQRWGGDVIFPILHGRWGEGGGLQAILDERKLPYVGTRGPAARLCMDKANTKAVLLEHGLPTAEYQVIERAGDAVQLRPPVVVKAVDEGSSIGLFICHNEVQMGRAIAELCASYPRVMIERYIKGREITVGVLDGRSLPPIQIVPATAFYDFEAKYDRDDTRYLFDIDLPAGLLAEIGAMALKAHEVLGARHLSRVDFLVDGENRPWILEINTLPGFTGHSLLPMAARQAGVPMPMLVDRLVGMGRGEGMEARRHGGVKARRHEGT